MSVPNRILTHTTAILATLAEAVATTTTDTTTPAQPSAVGINLWLPRLPRPVHFAFRSPTELDQFVAGLLAAKARVWPWHTTEPTTPS